MKRRKLMVDRQLQMQILGLSAVSGLIVTLCSVWCWQMLSSHLIQLLETRGVDEQITGAVVEILNNVTNYFFLLIAFSLIATWGFAIYISNRIAGPIFNMNRVIDKHLEGDKQIRVVIRKRDFFETLAARINRLLEKSTV